MLDGKKHLESYIENYSFNENNIQFRIHSSRSLETYKHFQSFNLNELVNGKFKFRKTSKEILLLKYDMWYRWLMRIEGYIVAHNAQTISKENIEQFINYSDSTNQLYSYIMSDHPEYFATCFTEKWKVVHSYLYEFLLTRLREMNGLSSVDFFAEASGVLTDVMNATVFELAELECMVFLNDVKINDKPSNENLHEILEEDKSNAFFLIFNDICFEYDKTMSACLLSVRLDLYKKWFPSLDTIYLKNYTGKPISEKLFKEIKKKINIDSERSLIKPTL